MERTWQALASYPAVEPSGGFSQEFFRRLRAEEAKGQRATSWQPIVGWQWMALAASICLFALILARQLPVPSQPAGRPEITRVDQWDDRFLWELEQSLDRTDADGLLSIYDTWPSSIPGADDAESTPGSAPKENGDPQREGV